MNFRNPRKRVPTAKSRQNKNISNLPAEPLAGNNSIPKQHVGIDQTNQLQFDQATDRIISPISNQTTDTNQVDFNRIPAVYFCIDENPFDLLPKDLFDISLSEDDELNQPETNKEPVNEPKEKVQQVIPGEVYRLGENNPNFKEIQSDEYEESPSQDERNMPKHKKTNTYLKEKIKNHPLGTILQKWIEQELSTEKSHSSYKVPISKFIEFLVDQEVQSPTRKHIVTYYVALRKDPRVKNPGFHMSAIRAFFRWAGSAGLYENVAVGTGHQLTTRMNSSETKSQNVNRGQEISNLNNKVQNKTSVAKTIITIRDMVNAKFLPTQAQYLINNDLVVFKRWIETLDDSDTNNQKKGRILRFAYFLYSENRTTPTQQDIVDYYNKELSHRSVDTANKSMLSIRNFFSWTAKQTIYPNITINTYPANRKPINSDDIPILPDEICMLPIPNPTEPLIKKTI